MKRCPKCGQGYTDQNINFCLNDGELLMQYTGDQSQSLFNDEPPTRFADDSPPTVVLDPARTTNQTNFDNSSMAAWQGSSPQAGGQPYSVGMVTASRDQTLPTISLVLGIISLLLVCCYGGIWLGLPAAIVGFLGMKNADDQPHRYGGRGMAVGGMVLGIITFLASVVFLIFGILAG